MDNPSFQGFFKTRMLTRSLSVDQETSHPSFKKLSLLHWRRTEPLDLPKDEFLKDADSEIEGFGFSPVIENSSPFFRSFEEFSSTSELTAQICQDAIKQNLLEYMKTSSGRTVLFDEVEKIEKKSLGNLFKDASPAEKNISFLWAAFTKRWDLLDEFLNLGAQLDCFEPNQGLGALHLAAFKGCIEGTQFLISNGADINSCFNCYYPIHCAAFGDSVETAKILLNHGVKIHVLTRGSHNPFENVLHCAVRASSINCVHLFIAVGVSITQVEPSGLSPLHLAADFGQAITLKIMLDSRKVDINIKTRDSEMTALHFAADGGCCDCIELLLQHGADVNVRNRHGQTPLYLAARAQDLASVEILLSQGRADPNIGDADQRIPLHAAVGRAARINEIVECLIKWGSDVHAKDQYGYTALHVAALNELARCVEILIYHGADVTAKLNSGTSALSIIGRRTPSSMDMVSQKLDNAITLHHHPESVNRDVELKLDFRSISHQHRHPREISFLNTFVEEGQKEILLHPLCMAFLYLKWQKIRKYYIVHILFSFIFVLFLTLYVLCAFTSNCYNYIRQINDTNRDTLCDENTIMGNIIKEYPNIIEILWYILVATTFVEIIRKLYGLAGYNSFRLYIKQRENVIEWLVYASVFMISFIYHQRTYLWQNHIAAFAVLLGWTNLMLTIGQLPIFGSFVAMFTKIQGEFGKLLLAYICLLIGFTISFCVIFPDEPKFTNPFIGMISVLTMMTGEIDLDLVAQNNEKPNLLDISAQVTYVLFLLFITVILMNLLVGIAVHDIQGLQKTAGLSKLVRQTKLIASMELTFFNSYIPRYFLKLLYKTALVSPKAYRVVVNVRPLNPRENRLPKDIMLSAYEHAKSKKYSGFMSSKEFTQNNTTSCRFKKSGHNFTQDEMDYHNSTLNNLQNKLEKGMEKVESLTTEVRELKIMLRELIINKSQSNIDTVAVLNSN